MTPLNKKEKIGFAILAVVLLASFLIIIKESWKLFHH